MTTPNLFRRGLTWFIRMQLPEDRWADTGQAMGAASGLRRDIVRTLNTRDLAEARRRREPALAAIRADVDRALEEAGKRPLTDWTAAWETLAVTCREELQAARREDEQNPPNPDEDPRDAPESREGVALDHILYEAELLERRQGSKAASAFLEIARGSGLTVAQGLRQWLATETGRVKGNTIASHEAAFRKLGVYLTAREGRPSLEAVPLTSFPRRVAGEFIEHRRQQGAAPETIGREAAAFNGLWRWSVRRGYAEGNPWADQTAGLKGGRGTAQRTRPGGQERAYTEDELGKLLAAGNNELAPNGGGYGATFWDLMRLLLLTGCRAGEMLELRLKDVIEDGTAIVVAADGRGKTAAASRIVPLHERAQAVLTMRLASIPTGDHEAPLWPEVPALGRDKRRSKPMATRFVAVRRRILGLSDEVDLHSFRRTFLTASETAMHRGGRLNPELIALLVGHQRGGLAFDLYSDWSRIGRGSFRGQLGDRLKVLREAVEDTVEMGLDEAVRGALKGTAGNRPAVVRRAPAFSRPVSAACPLLESV